jgi:hypothetical protein
MDKSHLTVQLVPTSARWLTRGESTALIAAPEKCA